jgi:hypothetical protein
MIINIIYAIEKIKAENLIMLLSLKNKNKIPNEMMLFKA